MKKFIYVLLTVLLAFGLNRVYALTEDELYDALTQTITINGAEWSVDSSTKTYIQRYLNQYDVSSADADYINSKINTAKQILQSEGTGELSKLSQSAKDQLKDLVTQVSNNTSVRATVTQGSVVVYEPGTSTPFFEVTRIVKNTGTGTSTSAIIASVAFLIVAAGACLVVKQVKQN